MSEPLVVSLAGHRVGELRRRTADDYELDYDRGWAERAEAVPLSLSLPLAQRRHRGRVVAAFVDNLLPDNPEVRQRWAVDAGLDTVDAFELLARYGDDVAGAMSFRPVRAEPSGERVLIDDDGIARRIRAAVDDPSAWHDDARVALGQFSLGGAQAKFSLALDGTRWFETRGSEPSTHIVKPRVRGVRDGELVEFVIMTATAALGIPVAEVSVFDHLGTHALVVRRFDRVAAGGEIDGASSVVRLHQEDILQALGLGRLRRFEADGGPGSDRIGRLLSDVADRESRRRYALALVLNWIVLSTDAHAKNFSVQIDPEQVVLAPLYDVSSVIPYLADRADLDVTSFRERADRSGLAVRYGASSLSGDVGVFEIEHLARRAGMDADELLGLALGLLRGLPDEVAAAAGQLPQRLQTEVVARLVEWMPERCRQAAEQLGLGALV